MTRICIFGAGAIGGYVGARLAMSGEAEVSLVARGPHLAAMKANGLTLKQGGEALVVRPALTDTPADLGPQDYIIMALKAYALPDVIDQLQPLIGHDTAILFAQNGIPWWYFYRHGGAFDGRRLDSIDPQRALGCVVWQAAEIEAPGVIAHRFGDQTTIGEPSGEDTDRVALLRKLLVAAGISSPVPASLRGDIWLKLWGNLSFNPVSVLTLGTLSALAADEGTRRVIRAMMEEARAIAEALGIIFSVDVDERMNMASRIGAHRSSMLQDLEAGRQIELDALLGVVIELGHLCGCPTAALQMIYDLVKFRSTIGAAGSV